MIRIRKGVVQEIIAKDERAAIVNVYYDGKAEKAFNYNFLTGDVEKGDRVYLNTTANHMMLGSGGYDFIIINETRGYSIDTPDTGGIMKMRYSPYQVYTGHYDESAANYSDLEGMAVICGELHSMLSPTSCALKYLSGGIRIAYIMTDGGSLPIDFSFAARDLRSKKIICGTVTYGHAFGGDVESVNIYDALLSARKVLCCDAAIVSMGPGIYGTGTRYGFSGIEQGYIIDAVNTLNGIPVVIPRISFADSRERHKGLSHHTITVLSQVAKTRAYVIFPFLQGERREYILRQINGSGIALKHHVRFLEGDCVFQGAKYFDVICSTMGRGMDDDPEFFLSCGSAAAFTSSYLKNYFRS